jgi:hypothetical protein
MFTKTFSSKQWFEHWIQTPPVQMLQHYPTFLYVDNVPEDTYELDEINQRFER